MITPDINLMGESEKTRMVTPINNPSGTQCIECSKRDVCKYTQQFAIIYDAVMKTDVFKDTTLADYTWIELSLKCKHFHQRQMFTTRYTQTEVGKP